MPSNDALYKADFDVTMYINQLFPTEQSLSQLDEVCVYSLNLTTATFKHFHINKMVHVKHISAFRLVKTTVRYWSVNAWS